MEPLATALHQLVTFYQQQHVAAWLVGGAARDLARGATPHDLDIAVDGNGLDLARLLANQLGAAFVPLDDSRGTGRVVWQPAHADRPLTIDMAQLRAATIDDDLRLRDFTLNALALPLATMPNLPPPRAAFRDPCNGWHARDTHTLTLCYPAALHDDPLRVLRAFRLAAELDVQLAPDVHAAVRDAAPLLARVASERVRDELLRLLAVPYATPWLRAMDDAGVLTQVIPELEAGRTCDQPIVHFLPVLAHQLEAVAAVEWLLAGLYPGGAPPLPRHAPTALLPVAVQQHPTLLRSVPYHAAITTHMASTLGGMPRRAWLKLAALLHDVAKPQTKAAKPDGGVSFYGHPEQGAALSDVIAKRLRLGRQPTAYLHTIIEEHMRPGQLRTAEVLTARAVARFWRDTGATGVDVLLHELADHIATRGPLLQPYDWANHLIWSSLLLDAYFAPPPERMHPLLDGNDLLRELHLSPGPIIGYLLGELHEAQAAGELPDRAAALRMARDLLARAPH